MGRRTKVLTLEEGRAMRAAQERALVLARERTTPRPMQLVWTLAIKRPRGSKLNWIRLVAPTEAEALNTFRRDTGYTGSIYAGPLRQPCFHAKPEFCTRQAVDAYAGWLYLCSEHWPDAERGVALEMHDAYVAR